MNVSNYSGKGSFIVSLDFELMWGVRDKRSKEDYGAAIRNVRTIIPEMVKRFDAYGVKATFATVGFLFHKNKSELLDLVPETLPNYENRSLSPYVALDSEIGDDGDDNPYYFADDIVMLINRSENHELATHTYCHYYCLEPGQNLHSFKADLESAKKVADRIGAKLESIVFPRNQYNESYVKLCGEFGILAYRGNEDHFIYRSSNGNGQTIIKRLLRFCDAYVNLTGYHSYSYSQLKGTRPINIPASRFLRPFSSKLRLLEYFKLARIKTGMTHAAKYGKVYHLWWHPHNFGYNTDRNLSQLTEILAHYSKMNKKYDFRSLTMSELAKKLID